MARKLRILLFSTLFPSSARPVHGLFVEARLRHLLASGQVDVRVVAPVPWFPFTSPSFGKWAQMAATPLRDVRENVQIFYPRYVLPPKIGMEVAPTSMAWGARLTVARVLREGFDFDLIDAHYYYPDGVAAAKLARWFNKPFVVTARGTDLNLLPQYPIPRRRILETAESAHASIGVCAALMDELRNMGADPTKLHVMRNGVDLERFRPLPRTSSRRELGLSEGVLLLSVGHLVERKGHRIAIETLIELPHAHLAVVGEGEERASLHAHVQRLGVADRVTFAGAVPNTELARWYSAADALILASSREGWPNVLLESMACGTPVVAMRTWGTPEVVQHPHAGLLVDEREPRAFAAALRVLLAAPPTPQSVRRYAERFSWQATTADQLALFRDIAKGKRSARG